jgi:hypothetical protein
MAAGDEALHERATDQPGAAGDEDPLAHGRRQSRPVSDDPKRCR